MPTVKFKDGQEVVIPKGQNLRSALNKHFKKLYHPAFRFLNCKGFGTCGTCAFKITSGDLTPPTKRESLRLSLPPHKKSLEKNIRLLCQCSATSDEDILIEKLDGLWGQSLKE